MKKIFITLMFCFVFVIGLRSLLFSTNSTGSFNESQKARILALEEFDFFDKELSLHLLDPIILPKPTKNWILQFLFIYPDDIGKLKEELIKRSWHEVQGGDTQSLYLCNSQVFLKIEGRKNNNKYSQNLYFLEMSYDPVKCH
mgnify:CR=1 FL=1